MTPSRGDAERHDLRASSRRSGRARCATGSCGRAGAGRCSAARAAGLAGRDAARRGRRRRPRRRRRRPRSCRSSSWSTSTRWFSYVSATMPSASARMRRFVSIVTKMVGRPPSFSRTSKAVCRMAWSIARVVDGARQLEALARAPRRGAMPPDSSGTPLESEPPRSRSSSRRRAIERALRPRSEPSRLNWSTSSMHVDGDDDVVVLEPEDGVRVVEEDVGVEDVVLLHRRGAARCE